MIVIVGVCVGIRVGVFVGVLDGVLDGVTLGLFGGGGCGWTSVVMTGAGSGGDGGLGGFINQI